MYDFGTTIHLLNHIYYFSLFFTFEIKYYFNLYDFFVFILFLFVYFHFYHAAGDFMFLYMGWDNKCNLNNWFLLFSRSLLLPFFALISQTLTFSREYICKRYFDTQISVRYAICNGCCINCVHLLCLMCLFIQYSLSLTILLMGRI